MARIGTKPLAALCRRLSVAMESGIDDRKIWRREAERARGRLASALQTIREAVEAGNSLHDGVRASGNFFPPLFRELVTLGEKTGKMAAIFRRLAEHYEHRLQLRRAFLAGITWPMIQLIAAVLIVGFLIWILGVIGSNMGEAPYDVLGLGLRGTEGLVKYILIVGSAVAIGVGSFLLLRSGAMWTRPVQRLVMALPEIGKCLETLAVSRIAWTLGLSLEAGMDPRRAVPLALNVTRNAYYTQHIASASAVLENGGPIYDALAQTGAFPDDFLDALEVAETSGRTDDYMLHLADLYQDRARAALARLAVIGGFLVWALVALLIIMVIVNIVSSYANFLQDLANPNAR